MKKIVCFGELLLRFSPITGRWINGQMPVFVGGAELNVATALARWNVPVAYLTALPDHSLSREILRFLNDQNIATDKVIFSGHRIGVYYLPQGTDLKNAGVIYDRAHSSFWELGPGQIDWDIVLQDVSWFHFSAISPALNANVAAICLEAVKAAAAKNITVSVDLNHRSKLWQWGKEPADVMPELVNHCTVVMGNVWATEKMLCIALPKDLPHSKDVYLQQAQQTSLQLINQYPRCRQVANTFRFDEGEGVRYYATLHDGEQFYVSPEYAAPTIVDKVGSGDAFMAGLIYGNMQGLSAQAMINFSAAAAFSKLFIKGDATTATVEDIQKTAVNDA